MMNIFSKKKKKIPFIKVDELYHYLENNIGIKNISHLSISRELFNIICITNGTDYMNRKIKHIVGQKGIFYDILCFLNKKRGDGLDIINIEYTNVAKRKIKLGMIFDKDININNKIKIDTNI